MRPPRNADWKPAAIDPAKEIFQQKEAWYGFRWFVTSYHTRRTKSYHAQSRGYSDWGGDTSCDTDCNGFPDFCRSRMLPQEILCCPDLILRLSGVNIPGNEGMSWLISAPVINDISLLHVTLNNGTSGHSSALNFGTFGYCVIDAARGK